jgi:hypothetical protein
VLVVVAALASAAPASAKEIVGLQLCGASGCVTERAGLPGGHGGPFVDGSAAVAPAAAGPWYRAVALMGDHGKVFGRFPFYFVPDGPRIVQPAQGAQTTVWVEASPSWLAVLERLAQRVKPYPAPTITRVSINGRTADNPQSYLRLYTIGEKATTYPKSVYGTQIVLESKRRTPWTDGNYIVLYPKDRLLIRDGQLVSISAGLTDRVADRASLATGGASFPWWPLAIAAALAASALVALALRKLPPRHPVPEPQS